VPEGDSLKSLRDDYQKMFEDRMFNTMPESFGELIRKCDDISIALNSRNIH
jgi:hypothetical protein